MFKNAFLIFSILFGCATFAQGTMQLKDGKILPSTTSWDFICNNYALGGTLVAGIAKTEKGGILKITVPVSDTKFYIGGTVYLFLDDNSIISCTDKGIRDTKDGFASGFYTFTALEMNKLKSTDIKNIRFRIKGDRTKFCSQTGFFSSINKISYYDLGDKNQKNSFDTSLEISSLYK